MNYKDEIKKSAVSELTKKAVGLVILVSSMLLAAALPFIRRRIAPELSKSAMVAAVCVLGALSLLLAAYLFRLRKKSNKFAFGAFWDRQHNPVCPSCKETNLILGRKHLIYSLNSSPPVPILECPKCDTYVELFDNDGKELTLIDAKRKLSESKGAI